MSHDGLLPFVSVIIPAFNEERYIRQCLESVLAQDYPPDRIEILLVDNNSTDSTSRIAKELLVDTGRGRVLHKIGGTIASVRNFGWHQAKGEILAFLDGDSVVERRWLRIGIEILKSSQDISCVGFSAAPPTQDDSWVERTWFPISSSGKHRGTIEVRWLSSFNLLLRRDFFEQIGGFDEALVTCEDAELGSRLSDISRLIFCDRCSVRHLGGVKTILEFIRKEYWRGQNSVRSFVQSNNKKAEFMSVAVPAIYLILFALLLVSFINVLVSGRGIIWLLTFIISIMLIPFLLSLRSGISHPIQLLSTSLLYMIYLLSRGSAVVSIRL